MASVSSVLETLALVDVDCIEELLTQLECELFAGLDQKLWVSVD
jgi:hypothetical protein